MASAIQKIALNVSRDIPFNKLVLSQSNVRRVKAGLSIEELARDIERRGLLQSLNARPVLNEDGTATGSYEVPAGGRRFRALELLVKQKKLVKTASVPCVVREAGSAILAEDDSLAENVQRVALHPLDQFRAFRDMLEKGMAEEEIAAVFFVVPAVVKQRLRLMTVSDKLLEIYERDGMKLDQLMAFSISDDHARQEQVWEIIAQSHNREPYLIRRMLTEKTVRASDRRVRFIGLEAYLAAGGHVMRDLFEADDGGWLQDPTLLDRLVIDKLQEAADQVRAEGWKWAEMALSFPWGHTRDFMEIEGTPVALLEEEAARLTALHSEQEGVRFLRLGLAYRGAQLEQDRRRAVAGDPVVPAEVLRATCLESVLVRLVEDEGSAECLADGCRIGRCGERGIVCLSLGFQRAAVAACHVCDSEGRKQRCDVGRRDPRNSMLLAVPGACAAIDRARIIGAAAHHEKS
ncbi:putative plasmid stabilization protein [Acetobacter tropicalis]|uniref:Putative plasmid stabilization protein n=1 Tax=Acetobacter tropicalis TaxID=104102 RepID=A0A094YFT9_9PROT|nr:putative plasmid stabilization protein [Acetobacter tropicalis]MDE5063495.1 ParB/RepB/Spo0J family partition protein [Wolbachia endosymbiont of Drosophila chauvacae]